MDTQHCLQCEFHKDRVDQDGCKYCYCFFNPDKGRWVAEIENCPKLGKHSGSSETPNDLEEAAEKHSTDYDSTIWCVLESSNQKTIWKREHKETFKAGAKWDRSQMMKEAVEGEVIVPIYEGDDAWSAEIKIPGRYEIGDKVRIIVCKKED